MYSEDDSDRNMAEAFFLPKFLDVPLVTTELNQASDYLLGQQQRPRIPASWYPRKITGPCDKALREFPALKESFTLIAPEMYPQLWKQYSVPQDEAQAALSFSAEVCSPILAGIEAYYREVLDTSLVLPSLRQLTPQCKILLGRMLWWNYWIAEYDTYRSSGGRDHRVFRYQGCRMLLSTGICILEDPASSLSPIVLTYDMLLGIKDALYVRFNTVFAASIIYSEDDYIVPLLLAQWSWQELCLLTYGNEGYELAKSTESLCKAYLSQISSPEMCFSNNSYAAMRNKHVDKEIKIRRSRGLENPDDWLCDVYEDTCLTSTRSLTHVAELFGLQKAISHPHIDIGRSGLSAAAEARSEDRTLPSSAMALRATYCRLFCEGYIRRHGRWPPMANIPKESRLHAYYSRGVLKCGAHDIPLADWDLVTFEKCKDFDFYPNFLEIIDDKSINVKYSERASAWDRKIMTTSERRMVLEVLTREDIDHEVFVRAIDDWLLDPEFFTVALTPKEREFKLAARMFAMLVLEIRNGATIIEANLAHSILPYFPQLTMADDKLTVHQRLLGLTLPLSDTTKLRLFIELDLSRWNLRWRELSVHMIGQDLNGIFGMKRVFSWIHTFFAKCMVYVRSGNAKPDGIDEHIPFESLLLWYYHLGGFEGLAQKLWSIATVAMIARAMDLINGAYTMTAQGDNVMLTVTMDRDLSLSWQDQYVLVRDQIIEDCSFFSELVNQDLKPEECIDSSTTVTYSKAIYCLGVDYPLTLKGLSRIFPTSALDFPSIDSYIASIFSTGHAAAESSKDPLRCYVVTVGQAALCSRLLLDSGGPYAATLRASTFGSNPQLTRQALVTPGELGGYSTLGFIDFLYRGGGDPLSKSLSSCFCLRTFLVEAARVMSRLSADDTYSKSPTRGSLVRDPYGLPIDKPMSPADAVTTEVLSVVTSTVRNVPIKEVLRLSTPAYEDELLDALFAMTPFNPVIAHDLYDCSILGTLEAVKKMFLTTRSIQSLAKRENAGDISGSLLRAATDNIRQRDLTFKRMSDSSMTKDTLYEAVSKARRRWTVLGINPEGLTSYSPVDFSFRFGLIPWKTEVRLSAQLPTSSPRFTRGSERVYLGVKTREKRSEHGYKITGKGMAKSALAALQRVYSWSDRNAVMSELIDHLSLSRSRVRLSEVADLLTTIIGGSASHRYVNRIASSDAHIMGQSTFASHCVFDSNEAGYLSATVDDYPIMFQEFFLYMLAQADLYASAHPNLEYCECAIKIGDVPLESIRGDRFTLPLTTKIPKPFSHLPRLIRDTSITLERDLFSPLMRLLPMGTMSKIKARTRSLDCILLRSLKGTSGLDSVLDYVVTRVKVPLGVLEFATMGLQEYLRACARVIIDLVGHTILFRRSRRGRKTSLMYGVLRYGTLLLDPIIPMLGHSICRGDPMISALTIGPELRYTKLSTTRDKLMSALTEMVAYETSVTTSSYYTLPAVLFCDADLDTQIQTITFHIRRLLSRLSLEGSASERECVSASEALVSALQQVGALQDYRSLELIVATFLGTDAGTQRIYIRNESVRTVLRNTLTGTGREKIYSCPDAAEESLREWRRPAGSYTPDVRGSFPLQVTPTREALRFANSKGIRKTFSDVTSENCYRLSRHLGMLLPYSSTAFLSWSKVIPYLGFLKALVVGSGHGGTALCCILGGAHIVYCHDLREDLPKVPHPSTYTPSMIRLARFDPRTSVTSQSYTTSGDVRNASILSSLLLTYKFCDIICVDLPLSLRELFPILARLRRQGEAQRVIIRTQHDMDETEQLSAFLLKQWYIRALIRVSTGGWKEEVFHVLEPNDITTSSVSMRVMPAFGEILDLNKPSESVELLDRSDIDRKRVMNSLGSELLAALGGLPGATLYESASLAYTVFLSMINDSEHKTRYRDWTSILHAAAAAHILSTMTLAEYVGLSKNESSILLPDSHGVLRFEVLPSTRLSKFLFVTLASVFPYRYVSYK